MSAKSDEKSSSPDEVTQSKGTSEHLQDDNGIILVPQPSDHPEDPLVCTGSRKVSEEPYLTM